MVILGNSGNSQYVLHQRLPQVSRCIMGKVDNFNPIIGPIGLNPRYFFKYANREISCWRQLNERVHVINGKEHDSVIVHNSHLLYICM